MKVLDLFAGIGGFSLGLEKAGMETVAFCEIDEYAQKVLKKNWPGVPIYEDVRQITANRLVSDGIGVDVITGGFPCQDISVAGNQVGIEGERSGLWTECARLLGDIRPKYAIFENVPNLLNGGDGNWFKRVLWDISKIGYDAEWHCIRASDIGAPHRRERIWIICYKNNSPMADTQSVQHNGMRFNENQGQAKTNRIKSGGSGSKRGSESREAFSNSNSKRRTHKKLDSNQARWEQTTTHSKNVCENVSNPVEGRLQRRLQDGITYQEGWEVEGFRSVTKCGDRWERYRESMWATEPSVGRVANGVPNLSHRLKCLGNAVVPQIPELIGRAIMEHELATVA